MPKLLRVFVGLTIALAAMNVWLYYQLEMTRAELEFVRANEPHPAAVAASAAVPIVRGAPAAAALPPTPADASAPKAAVASASAGPGTAPPLGDTQRRLMLPFARQFLAQYDDPSQRPTLARQSRTLSAGQYSQLREKLKLSPEKFDELLGLLADEQLDQQANYFRCVVNPDCDPAHLLPPPDRSAEFQALLGDDYDEFAKYRGSLGEWQSVAQLRGRLSDANALRDSDAERLVGSLSAEAARIREETSQQGATLKGWGNGTGMVWYTGDGAIEQQIASAQANAQRMRQRVVGILSAEQLRVFDQLQDDLLEGFASYMRQNGGK